MTGLPASEFRRPFAAVRLAREAAELHLAADAGERAALARRFLLPALHRLEAHLKVELWRRGGVRVRGNLVADLEQRCVVTLDPFSQQIDEPIERLFLPAEELPKMGEEIEVSSLEEEPEPLPPDGRIDLGEVVAETLSLALDPYPRKPGVSFEEVYRAAQAAAPEDQPHGEHPFAVLEKLKKEGD